MILKSDQITTINIADITSVKYDKVIIFTSKLEALTAFNTLYQKKILF
jgi:hypothetical protein